MDIGKKRNEITVTKNKKEKAIDYTGALIIAAVIIALSIIIGVSGYDTNIDDGVLRNESGDSIITFRNNVPIQWGNSPSIDAFVRARISQPFTIFDSKQTQGQQLLFWDIQTVSGSGTNFSFNKNRASTTLNVSANTAGHIIRQTYRNFNYQPGKSQLVILTVAFGENVDGVTKRVGYHNDGNGIYYMINGTRSAVAIRSNVTGTPTDNIVYRDDWNLDKLDGTGQSGITLNKSAVQILIMDFEWLGSGRVRIGFLLDGNIIYVHEFLNANNLGSVYMSTPNLPVRYEIENDGTGAASSIESICTSVISEGGVEPSGRFRSIHTGISQINANSAGTYYTLIAIKLTDESTVTTALKSLTVGGTGNTIGFYWSTHWNPTFTVQPTFTAANNSGILTAIGNLGNPSTTTLSNPGLILDSGFVPTGTNPTGVTVAKEGLENALVLGRSINGTEDVIVLAVRPITNNLDAYATITWQEQQ